MTIKFSIAIVFLLLAQANSYGQNVADEYTIENTWGINKSTSSGLIGGVIFKHSVRNSKNSFTSYGLELINVKHPAEQKIVAGTGNSFTLSKTNRLFAIRGQYGREYLLFKKAPQQGIQINLILTVGPSIGLESPYYIVYDQTSRVPYDPSIHNIEKISDHAFFLQGVFQSNIVIGANVKTALSFEFGSQKSSVSGFEAGFLLDAYTRKINMISEAENYAVWPTAFITLFYGSRK